MKKSPALYCIILLFLLFSVQPCFAQDVKQMQKFTDKDRILILVPHPDDEVMATGGVIQKALKAKARVKILFLTNGDHNEPAFIVYEKRLTIRKGEFIHMGQVRRAESLEALKRLGLAEKDCVFLGYPDYGTMEILLRYWGDTKPFKYMLTRISKVPYSNCLSPGAPYVGESILKDIEKVIKDFKPTKVFVSNPVDVNRDHRSLYLFLQVALWDLEGEIKMPLIFPYIVHVEGWPEPRGYHPDLELLPPELLKNDEISWQRLDLTDEEVKMKHDAMEYYKSENEYNPVYIFTFARKNELTGDLPLIKLSKDIAWRNAGTNLAYGRKGNDLLIRIALKNKFDKDLGMSIFLLGYRKGQEFSKMPKLAINIGIRGLSARDRRQKINGGQVQLTQDGKILKIKVPMSLLNDPVYILACAKAGIGVLPFGNTAWRIIKFE